MNTKANARNNTPEFYIKAARVVPRMGATPIASVRIIGSIGWETNADEFRAEVEKLISEGISDCHIYINSPGGSCFDANEIVNIIRGFKGKITGEGGALVASAATRIAAECATFSMPENGIYMIHKPSGVAMGRSNDIESYLKLIKDLEAEYLSVYKKMAVDEAELLAKWEAGDWWLTAKEAKEKGFITGVIKKTEIDEKTTALIASCGCPFAVVPTEIQSVITNKKSMRIIALILGLPEDATEEQITAKIKELQAKAGITDTLQAEIAGIRDAQITSLVDAAQAANKFTADKKEHFIKLGKTAGVEVLKTTLDVMQAEVKPNDLINKQNANGGTKKYSELSAEERVQLREQDPASYKKLYKEEYGVEPVIN